MKKVAAALGVSMFFTASCGNEEALLTVQSSYLMNNENGKGGFVVVNAYVHNKSSDPLYLSTTSFKIESEDRLFLLPDVRETNRFHENCNRGSELPPKTIRNCRVAFSTAEIKPTLTNLLLESKSGETAAITKLSAFFPTYPTEMTFDEVMAMEGAIRIGPPKNFVTVKSKETSFPLMRQLLSAIENDVKLANLNKQQKVDTTSVLRDINFSLFDNISSLFINAAKAGLKMEDMKIKDLNIDECEIIVRSFFTKSSEIDSSSIAQFQHSLIEAFEKENAILQAFTWAMIADIFLGVFVADKISLIDCSKSEDREQLRRLIVNYKSTCGTKSGCSPLNRWVPSDASM